MKASELRPGNYVSFKGRPMVVNNVHGASGLIHVLPDGTDSPNTCSIHDFEPIIITDDWLKKFGFVRRRGDLSFSLCKEVMCISPEYNIFIKGRFLIPVPMHVHTFQNLWFALTCNEIAIL